MVLLADSPCGPLLPFVPHGWLSPARSAFLEHTCDLFLGGPHLREPAVRERYMANTAAPGHGQSEVSTQDRARVMLDKGEQAGCGPV